MGRINVNKGQMKIQQMAFMIIAVFFFFILAGLFLLNIYSKDIRKSANQLERENAISSIEVIADMSELNCDSGEKLCLDEDKLLIMSGNFGKSYNNFWPVASIEVLRIYPHPYPLIECPSPDCNHYNIYDNGQREKEAHSSFVSICRKAKGAERRCEIGLLIIGARIKNEK